MLLPEFGNFLEMGLATTECHLLFTAPAESCNFRVRPMDVIHQRLLVAAQGYSELGLPELALTELALVPEDHQHEAVVVETRLSVLMQARRFRDALPFSQELCRLQPDRTAGFIHAAFCLHELGNTFGARELLLSGPPSL